MSFESIVAGISERKPDADQKSLKAVKAFFQFPVIPEYLPSEALMASCYRALGFASLRDVSVSQNGKALWKLVSTEEEIPPAPFNRNEVRRLLRDVLLSPEDPSQKRGQKYPDFLFLAPLVPATALFSNPIRLNRNANSSGGTPWNVDTLLKALISYSSLDNADNENLWNCLFSALSVQDDNKDDFFARIIEHLLQEYAKQLKESGRVDAANLPVWTKNQNDIASQGKQFLHFSDREAFSGQSPLDEIRNGLRLVLDLKPMFSRWQWLTILDAHLRMSMMAFMMWLLDLHHVASLAIQRYVLGEKQIPAIPSRDFIQQLCSESHEDCKEDFFFYGEGFSKAQVRIVTRYARDMIRIAFFLDAAKELNPVKFNSLDWSTVEGFVSSLKSFVPEFHAPEIRKDFEKGYVAIADAEKNVLNYRKGRLKHFLEFFAVLRQKTVIDGQRDFIRYDQSFFVRKKGRYSRAPFIVDLGSVSCFTVAYCCANGRRVFPKKDLKAYLEKFFIKIRSAHNDQFVGHLKGLGLTMDSPDADDGLMILNPFFREENR